MNTKLSFEAPVDLSVGRVRIGNADREIANWVATPDARNFSGDVEPGFYAAEISPPGVQSQSVVFEVAAGQDNRVVVPSFSSLLAGNGNTTFLGIRSPRAAIEALFGGAANLDGLQHEQSESQAYTAKGRDSIDEQTLLDPSRATQGEPSKRLSDGDTARTATRRLSIGLAVEAEALGGSYVPFPAPADIELSETRLALTVSSPERFSPDVGARVRLSVAVEGVRVERLLLPMYRGGSQIVVRPSALSANDVGLEVLPSDARLRALARALIAGTDSEAQAVVPFIRTVEQHPSTSTSVDPWEAMLSALLSIRFPDRITGITSAMADNLVAVAPWAYDAYVIQARQHLYAAEANRNATDVMGAALRMLRNAQILGAPYFSYSNQIFAQLIEALHGILARNGPTKLCSQASRIRTRWRREQALQSSAGASFSWLRRDKSRLGQGILTPHRTPTGALGASSTLLFSGHIAGGLIQFDPGQAHRSPKDRVTAARWQTEYGGVPDGCPALSRPAGPVNDPNLGRFGGSAASSGYRLQVQFAGDPKVEAVAIAMVVEADQGVVIAPGSVAWFCLHPTFPWRWVKVMFGNGRAVLSVVAWGGFTVGVWLPEAGVELECDLSSLPIAPRIIRDP